MVFTFRSTPIYIESTSGSVRVISSNLAATFISALEMVSCPKMQEIVNKEIQVTRKVFLIIIKSKKI
jgi:hypothetical protein